MTYISTTKYFLRQFRPFKKDYPAIIVCSIVIPVFIILYTSNSISGVSVYGNLFSLADCFVWVMKPHVFGFLITPITLVLLYLINRTDFNLIYVLRYKKINELFFIQTLKNIWVTFYITVVTIISIIIIGGCMVVEFINWDKPNSVFCIIIGETVKNVKIIEVICMFMLTSWLRLFFICTCANCIYWIFRFKILPFILIIALASSEMIFPKYKIFYLVLNIDYKWWLEIESKRMYIIYVLIFSLVLVVLSKYAISKKEFLDEH